MEDMSNFDDLDDDEEERKIKNFMKDLPGEVSFRRPSSKQELWAFWSEPTLSPCNIIKSALLHSYQRYGMSGDFLIQFWAPITTETGCVQLATSDQPFALSYHLDERLLKYRKHCLQYKFNVDGNGGEEVEHLGIPGRVFRQKWHECIPNVRLYSTKEYPQRDFALACHIFRTSSFPVFQTSYQGCVGVLEFAATTNTDLFWTIEWFIKYKLQTAGLKTSLCDFSICERLRKHDRDRDLLAEIYKGLEVVCKTHNLPLANTWFPCGHFNGLAFDGCDTFNVSHMGQFFHQEWSSSYLLNDNMGSFFLNEYGFHKGQGVVRSAYLSHKLCFCRDITQFSISEYPFLPLARSFGLTGCFAICLRSSCAKNYHNVLEFFLNPKNTYGEDPSIFLCSILETMKQHFPSFKVASGEELGKELLIEFINPRLNQELASFQCQSTLSPSRPGVLQNGQEMMQPHSSNQQLIVEVDWDVVHAEQNNVPITRPDETCMNHEPDFSQCQSSISLPRLEVSHNGQETTQPHPPNQQLTDEVEVDHIKDGRNVNANSIAYEELEKYFGKKLEYVAQIFGVSRSTFKRICRDNKINRWPRSKRKKVEGSPSRREPPRSDLPAKKLVAHHTTPLVRPPPEARTMTIKATCGDDMIKFQLPFSSRMVELEEEVSKRLKFHVGTYKIKYTDDDGDRILISCDKDLEDCMSASNSLGMNTIKMFIEPINRISQ